MKALGWVALAIVGAIAGIFARGYYHSHEDQVKGIISGTEDRVKAVCHAVVHGSKVVVK